MSRYIKKEIGHHDHTKRSVHPGDETTTVKCINIRILGPYYHCRASPHSKIDILERFCLVFRNVLTFRNEIDKSKIVVAKCSSSAMHMRNPDVTFSWLSIWWVPLCPILQKSNYFIVSTASQCKLPIEKVYIIYITIGQYYMKSGEYTWKVCIICNKIKLHFKCWVYSDT